MGLLDGTPTPIKNVFGRSFDVQINVHLISYSTVWVLHFAFFTRFEVDNFGCSTLDPQRTASEAGPATRGQRFWFAHRTLIRL